MAKSFDRVVVQIDVTDFQTIRESVGNNGVTVVLGRDINPARFEVFHRLVTAPVAEMQLERARTERPGDHLVAQTDTHHRDPACKALRRFDRAFQQYGIARPRRQHHTVRVMGQDFFSRCIVGDNDHLATTCPERPQDVQLHPVIADHDL